MKEINLDWWATSAVNFKLRMNGSNLNHAHSHSVHFWSAPKADVIEMFCSMFSENDYRGLYKSGKIECAELAKPLLKACASGQLEVQATLAAIELIRSETLRPINTFFTLRLIGKKLCDVWNNIYRKNSFSFDPTIERVLEIQFSNLDNEPFISFMKDNEKELRILVRDYENFRKPDFL